MSIEATRELETLASVCPELNMANYTEDDVRHLNDWAIEMSLLVERCDFALQARAQVQGELEPYDAGLLNDFGGGNVEWWQDYIRAELGRAHDFYQSQIATPQSAQATQAVPMTDAVAYAIHQVIKPSNMTDSDWHSGAMLGHENEYREKVEQAATRAILALRTERVPMTDEQRNDLICTVTTLGAKLSRQALVGMAIDWTEAHHGIKPKEQA